jgi:hypothetical protein
MKLNEHERARPNLAGVASSGQEAEMKLLLAGGWPSLKPLPVFKYESADCRASIEFDKARGEWVCRKTFFPSNNVQELRGGLTELTKALPPTLGEQFVPRPATAHQEQEFGREADRRLQAILEWKANFENGAVYSDLQRYLSESQKEEIEEILRLTLTARQLQFSPKNIACVFDGLSKAGGRLATLLEVAKRKDTLQLGDVVVNEEAPALDGMTDEPDSGQPGATIEGSPVEEIVNVFSLQEQSASDEAAMQPGPEVTVREAPRMPDANPLSFLAERAEKVNPPVSAAAFRPEACTRKVDAAANRTQNLPSRGRALEISGVHIAAFAVLFLFAVISLPIGLTVGRGPLGQWFRDIQQAIFAGHAAPPAAPVPSGETASPVSAPSAANAFVDIKNPSGTVKRDDVAPSDGNSVESARNSESFAEAPSTVSNLPQTKESKPSAQSDPSATHDGSARIIARVAPPSATPKPADSFQGEGPVSGAWKNRASRSFAPSMGASPHRATASGILVTTPGHGSKPFRVNFPQKPIAASSSFAMTSELSVLVPPEPGPAAASKSARLQAGELVYFAWPRYSRQGDRYGSAETVRVRATVGQFGQVLDVKLLSGSNAIFPAARNAVHLWRYRPTLLNNRRVAVQQDITIEFRPPQYLSQVRTQHP